MSLSYMEGRRTDTSTAADRPIYLDHHATTPVDPRVAEVMFRVVREQFGNANSVDHVYGELAAAEIVDASENVAALVGGDPADVQFTSGATEGIRLAIEHAIDTVSGARRPLRVAASLVEHPAVIHALNDASRRGSVTVRWIGVDSSARLDLEALHKCADSVDLICVMAANNEVGTVYPIEYIAQVAQNTGALLLVDASQAAGRVPLDLSTSLIHYLILSGHKMYAPKGVGAVVTSAGPWKKWTGRGHAGTLNVPAISAFGAACRIYRDEWATEAVRTTALRDVLQERLASGISGLIVNGDRAARLPHNLHVSVPDVPNSVVISRVRRHLAVSTGAACSSGVEQPSHVLRAMRLPQPVQEGALRISLGRFTTLAEIDRASEVLIRAVAEARATLKGIRTA